MKYIAYMNEIDAALITKCLTKGIPMADSFAYKFEPLDLDTLTMYRDLLELAGV